MTIGFKNPENNLFEILTPSKKGNLKKVFTLWENIVGAIKLFIFPTQ